MKINYACIPCLLNRVIFESRLVINEEEKIHYIMKKILEKFSEIYDSKKGSAEIATEIHALAYELIGNKDPYKNLKEESNKIALLILPKARKIIEGSENKLEKAILCSIVANSIDFGIEGSVKLEELFSKFEEYLNEGFYINDFEKMEKYLKGEILYFTDNCGEIVFDKIVCEMLKEYDVSISLVCKKYPILTDATYEDAIKIGFQNVADEILTTGKFSVGINFSGISEKLKRKLKEASIIICKGMANYESFSETKYKPIAYLMRVKCNPIAQSIGAKKSKNILKIYE
ncbi:MAG: ARMT1-like domain-containing protein [Candidatus Aenigmatarchaeota archaeon]